MDAVLLRRVRLDVYCYQHSGCDSFHAGAMGGLAEREDEHVPAPRQVCECHACSLKHLPFAESRANCCTRTWHCNVHVQDVPELTMAELQERLSGSEPGICLLDVSASTSKEG